MMKEAFEREEKERAQVSTRTLQLEDRGPQGQGIHKSPVGLPKKSVRSYSSAKLARHGHLFWVRYAP